MLDVPVQSTGTSEKQTEPAPPCFRCLFEKPISEGWCNPSTCDMLEFWLMENDFKWQNHVADWLIGLELKHNHVSVGDGDSSVEI